MKVLNGRMGFFLIERRFCIIYSGAAAAGSALLSNVLGSNGFGICAQLGMTGERGGVEL